MKKINERGSGSYPIPIQLGNERKLILYIEDEADNREVTVLRLRDKYDILWARDDAEACELIIRNHDRLYAILMDIQLKGSQIDGIKLTRLLRGQPISGAPSYTRDLPLITIPIIFVTAYGTRYSEDELLAAGGSHVITKPVNFGDLSLALTTAYTRRQSPPAGIPRRDPLSIKDALTGLFTHRYFLTMLSAEITRASQAAQKVGLAIFNLDHFNAYNNRCGRAQGDALLWQLAMLVTNSIDPSSTRSRTRSPEIACRYGGGEIALLLADTDIDAARSRAESIRKAVSEHPFPEGEGQPDGIVTVSVGVAAFPQCAAQYDQLVEAAERALRQAKLSGRNRVEIARRLRFE